MKQWPERDSSRPYHAVARAGGVSISAAAGGFVSFTNSPYYSHEHGQAVDIYPLNPKCVAFSPVEGRVSDIFTVKSPRPRHFQAAEEEQLVIIRPVENEDLAVRILHVRESPEKDSEVSVGTPLGEIARSGFYDFWTERHIHVEVRSLTSNLLRAKGSLPIESPKAPLKAIGTPAAEPPALKVVDSNPSFALVNPEYGDVSLGILKGIGCTIGRTTGILDAGVPHYRLGSVHLEQEARTCIGTEVILWGTAIGEVVESKGGIALFKPYPIEIRVNDEAIRGLSFYPWIMQRPLLKLIPHRPNQTNWRPGREVTINIH
ncbi:hypothetical protein MUP00_10675 [Candidatus Bathyarchaeota archaeon]|nr:hypothetical protein [Candidatus Bathyarchaeota archaeon]